MICSECGFEGRTETKAQRTKYGYVVHVHYCPICGDVKAAGP